MLKTKKLPPRSAVKPSDRWNLALLFRTDAAWETAFKKWEKRIDGYGQFAGRLADSPKVLAECLEFDNALDRQGERLRCYAFLRTAEDTANSVYQRMMGRCRHAMSIAAEAASFMRPEILAIPAARMQAWMESDELAPHRLALSRLLRYKPHTLGKAEEMLLAMQTEMAEAAEHAFFQLHDADMKFGYVENEKGQRVELSNASLSVFMHSADRAVRAAAFHQYYEQYAAHENTLAATLGGSMHRDIYYARARGYDSARAAALFADNMPLAVYDNLITSVHRHLPAVHRYYELRRRKMRLRDLHYYDTFVPILSDLETRHSWDQAVRLVIGALEPLGDEYCAALERGLNDGWCDRYPNQGKRSGAFSSGSYDSAPYIMMNYQPDVLDHVFILAHEAGHSMHTYYSTRHQPFQYYHYTIFVAEVASTFNEQLLGRRMMAQARDDRHRAYLINREIDAIRSTIIRQTMFAEFEKQAHETLEAGEPLTVDRFKQIYGKLLTRYFGDDLVVDDCLPLECFRIPHFYRAFYVYKYATGMSAAIALADRVTQGGPAELAAYLGFLRGGCSKFPLELLRDAGVDMLRPEPVDTALRQFARLVAELDELLQRSLPRRLARRIVTAPALPGSLLQSPPAAAARRVNNFWKNGLATGRAPLAQYNQWFVNPLLLECAMARAKSPRASASAGAAKQAAQGGISKAERIRRLARQMGSSVRPRDIIAKLKEEGISVTSPLVSKTLKAAGFRRKPRSGKAAPAAAKNHAAGQHSSGQHAASHPAAAHAAKGSINKAELIRQTARAIGKRVRPRDIIATLRARGVHVSSPQVSSTLRAAGFRRKRRRAGLGVAGVAATGAVVRKSSGNHLDLEALIATKALVQKLGGVHNAEMALNALKRLQ